MLPRPRKPSVLVALTIATVTLGLAQPISDKTALEFSKRLEGLGQGPQRVERLIQIAWYERPGGELQAFTQAQLENECAYGVGVLIQHFKTGPLEVRRNVLRLMNRRWQMITRGSDPLLIDLVGQALNDPDPSIHRSAAAIAAGNALEGIANAAIDAATAAPELTVAALRAIAVAGDLTGARWSIRQLQSLDPRVRQTALNTVATLARATLPLLRVQLDSSEPRERTAALEGLLLVATREDLPLLTRWLEHADNPAQVEPVTKAIAALEAGRYAPKPPPAAEPLFVTPLPEEPASPSKQRKK